MNTPKQYSVTIERDRTTLLLSTGKIGLPIGVVCKYEIELINFAGLFSYHNINHCFKKKSKKTSEWHDYLLFNENRQSSLSNPIKIKKDLNTLLDQEYFHKKNNISQEKLNV
jgi:hypothetical protein